MTVDGGSTRAESVANALAAVDTEYVAIHDAARPLLTPELLTDLVAALAADPDADGDHRRGPGHRHGQEGPCRVSVGMATETRRARSTTPWIAASCGGRRRLRSSGRRRCARRSTPTDAATDEAMLVEAAGGTVLLHDPGAPNLKVTTPLDLRVAELLLAERR